MIEGKPSESAQMTCLFRALEYARHTDGSLLSDEYAREFLTGKYDFLFRVLSGPFGGLLLVPPMRWLYDWIVLRHAFLDEMVRKLGPRMPVIALGSGYDSRGLRLREHLKHGFFEIDYPATQERKLELLRLRGLSAEGTVFYKADFTGRSLEGALEALGLRGAPAFVVWEGVTMYLEERTVRETIQAIGGYFGPSAVLAADFWASPLGRLLRTTWPAPLRDLLRTLFDEPLLFGTRPEELREIARGEGAKTCEIRNYGDLLGMFARGPAPPFPLWFLAIMEF